MTMENQKNENKDSLSERYLTLFTFEMSFEQISEKLRQMENDPEIIELRTMLCNEIIYCISSGDMEYPLNARFGKDSTVKILLENIEKLPEDKSFYYMMYGLYTRNEKMLLKHFDISADINVKATVDSGNKLTEEDIVDLYIEPLKSAFPGFWAHAEEKLREGCEQDGTHELCSLMERVYGRRSDDDAVDALSEFVQKYPDIVIAKEFLALLSMNLGKWHNSVAYFESIEEKPMLFANTLPKMYFLMSVAYMKTKDMENEEQYLRKSLEQVPEYEFALNNLGYCLYKQKKYAEAKEILEKCVEKGYCPSCSANNLVRVLMAMGRYRDARAVANNSRNKVAKVFKEKLGKLPNTNERIKGSYEDTLTESDEITDGVTEESSGLEVRKSQFTTEKILEDELTARIESGVEVFGKKLRVYKRKGQYGRQFIIPIGRLDILCEDDAGDLYIVELKKDSGYDDVYKQTSEYLDWFEKNSISEGRKVYGIICLNHPTPELIRKVHSDKRMSLFEYRVSYHEI